MERGLERVLEMELGQEWEKVLSGQERVEFGSGKGWEAEIDFVQVRRRKGRWKWEELHRTEHPRRPKMGGVTPEQSSSVLPPSEVEELGRE